MPVWDASQFLQQQGFTPTGNANDSAIEVRDQSGQIGSIPTDALKQHVLSQQPTLHTPESPFRIAINNPDQPTDERDPRLTLTDLTARALGNSRGFANHMMEKVGKDNVRINSTGDVVLYNPAQSRWNVVDKSIWGMIKDGDLHELSKDLYEMLPDAAIGTAATAGGAVGAAAAGPIGAGIGAMAGGGMAAASKTILGKLTGLRDSTPQEDVRDLGVDMLLSAAPTLLSTGVKSFGSIFAKPTIQKAQAALANIAGKSEAAVNDAAAVLAKTSDLSMAQAKRSVQSGQALLPKAKAVLDSWKGNAESAVAQLEGDTIKNVRGAVDAGFDKVHSDYAEGLNELLQSSRGAVIRPGQMLKDTLSEAKPGILTATKDGSLAFTSDQQAAEALSGGLSKLDKDTLQPLLNRVNALRFSKDQYGEAGSQLIVNAEKDINQIMRNINKSGSISDSAKMHANDLATAFKTSVKTQFENAGLGDEFAAMKAPYIKYMDKLKDLDGASDSHILEALSQDTARGVDLSKNLIDLTKYSNQASGLVGKAVEADTTKALTKVFSPNILNEAHGRNIAKRVIDAGIAAGAKSPYAVGRLLKDVSQSADSQAISRVKSLLGVNPSEVLKDPKAAKDVTKALLLLKGSMVGASAHIQKGSLFGEDSAQLQTQLDRAMNVPHEIVHTATGLMQDNGVTK